MPKRYMLTCAMWLAGLLAVEVGAVEVKLAVQETGSAARSPAAVTTGVPFARGAVKDLARLSVSSGGKPVPAQFTRLAGWDDGSVRWALLDVQVDVPAGGKAELVVSDSGGNPAPAAGAKVEDTPDAVRVSTGPLQLVVSRKKFNLIESLKVDGRELLTSAGRGLVVYKDGGGEVVAGPPTEVKVEQAGPVRAVVCLRGKFPGVHNDLLGYTVRITALAGQKSVKVHAWLENHGAMGYYTARDEGAVSKTFAWFPFDGMAVELGLGLGQTPTAACEGVQAAGALKVLQVCKQVPVPVARGQYPKPPFYTWDNFEYTITSKGEQLKKGPRTDGVVTVKGQAGGLTAAVRDFWQNYEKAIELDGATLKLWLWPTEGQWPRPRPNLNHGSLYDRTLQAAPRDGLYCLPGGVHKGHEFILDFSGRDARESAAELSAPLLALASADYYASTGAAPGLFAPPEVRTGDRECDAKLDAWLRMTRSAADPDNPTSLFKARQVSTESIIGYFSDSSYWFGWMDFGDLAVPGRGPVCLHYDWPWIMLVNLMRTGEVNFFRLAADMARHRIDIDQHWSDQDPPDCRGLQRGEFNFPAYHCYRLYRGPQVGSNFLAGTVLYYMLTGEPKALDCARRNADGLKAAWESIARGKPYGGPQGDMAASAWSISAYCAMYDLTADRKWLDEALGLFNTNVVAKWKSYGPFLHDPAHQIQSQDYIQDDMKYCYAIQSLCELHHRTGDEQVFKLLKDGCEKEFPESFFEAPVFLSGLYAYVGQATGDAELVAKAAGLFAQGFPESKSPPVFLPDNTTWSRTSAMMLRTGHLLQYAQWKAKKR